MKFRQKAETKALPAEVAYAERTGLPYVVSFYFGGRLLLHLQTHLAFYLDAVKLAGCRYNIVFWREMFRGWLFSCR